jgi:hypothetical protein
VGIPVFTAAVWWCRRNRDFHLVSLETNDLPTDKQLDKQFPAYIAYVMILTGCANMSFSHLYQEWKNKH